MTNSFNLEELARYYDDHEVCRCGAQATDWHHAIKRAEKYADSLLNATPICRECHSHHGKLLRNYEPEIERNARRLHKEGYRLTQLDLNFLTKHDLVGIVEKILWKNS